MSGAPDAVLAYARHAIDAADVAAVAGVLESGYLTTGPAVAAFEDAFAEAVGAPFAVSCSSGTAALHLAALALELEPGERVVVPSITFVATANAARYVGAEVVFADVDPRTGMMTPGHLEAALARAGGAAAVFPVHLAGQAADPPAIAELARAHGARVVEDACHALGAEYRAAGGAARRVGACADAEMAVFSLHPAKTITMGEGGVVTTRDSRLAASVRRLRNHGLVRDAAEFDNADLAFDADGAANPWYYELHALGLNYRASDIHCALGLSQLAKLGRFVARRRALAERYDRLLAPLAPVVRPIERVPRCTPAWHLYVVRIDFAAAGASRARVMRGMGEAGIGTQVHFVPVHLQPYYRRRYGDLDLPGARAYYQSCLSLPLHPGMKDDDVDRVAEALGTCLGARAGAA